MAQLADRVLQALSNKDETDTIQLAEELKEDHQKIIGAVKSLQSLGDIIEAHQLSRTKTELTAEGKSFVEKGSHEAIVFSAVPPGDAGISQPELMKCTGGAGKIGMSKAISSGWIKTLKEGNVTKVVRVVESIEDNVRTKLKAVGEGDASGLDNAALADLKKRKLLVQTPVIYYSIKKGPGFTVQVVKLETELTPEMLLSGEWKKKKFKPYNFQALGIPLNSGHLHPLMKVRAEFRSILLEMGFSEMPTNRFVESSFWNFDALYVPQKHPARDAQDTFFMSQPDKCSSIPKEFMERVKAAHTGQDYDTLGYGPVWKEEESYKNCMRTHTTAVSARMLHAIGSKSDFKPAKLFSIDRVYRNETLDATHLAEFHQVEGVVADYNLNLGNLIGIMKEFFGRLGITKLRFKPAYNPYTEPSMEVFSYHEGLKKWVEVGNSGMFRPEMLLPMGIPKDVRVIAWGLSLERPTMIRYGIDNIRDLVGPRVDLQMVYNNPICRLDTKFEIGSDGSYLDNPLLKSPKKGKSANVTKDDEPASLEEQTSATTTSKKNKKKKKKKNKENSGVGEGEQMVGGGITENISAAGIDSIDIIAKKDKEIVPSKKESKSKVSPEESRSLSTTDTTNIASVAAAEAESIAAARFKVISDHLQAGSSGTSSTSKSSKKKRKSKVKNQPS